MLWPTRRQTVQLRSEQKWTKWMETRGYGYRCQTMGGVSEMRSGRDCLNGFTGAAPRCAVKNRVPASAFPFARKLLITMVERFERMFLMKEGRSSLCGGPLALSEQGRER